MGGGGGVPDTLPTFCFSAKEGQLVQVMVSPCTCPTFVLSVAVVLLVVLLVQLQANGKSMTIPHSLRQKPYSRSIAQTYKHRQTTSTRLEYYNDPTMQQTCKQLDGNMN